MTTSVATWSSVTTHLLSVVISLGGGEHQEVRLHLPGEDLLSGLMVEINNERQGLGADELGNVLLSQLKRISLVHHQPAW